MSQNACKGCVYYGRAGAEPICEYILMEQRRRPCPPGEGCTVKIVGGTDMKQKAWDEARARQLYEEGKSDIDIADMVGASAGAIAAWRRKNHLVSKNQPVRKKAAQKPSAEAAPCVTTWPIEVSFSFGDCVCSLTAPDLEKAQLAAAYLSKSVAELELAIRQAGKEATA